MKEWHSHQIRTPTEMFKADIRRALSNSWEEIEIVEMSQ